MLILTAMLTNSLVTNLCMLFGVEAETASNIGFGAMIIAAFIVYSRMTRHRRK
ncbi:hypothetical protein E6C60_0333 [Paenibacillus algicola]|uniref:Uncharacterized protein n=2 Tax=Paenibacillus TaxID=44249 RepID=A0A4P8XF80_9BACL|nr:hypothetical protein E6C60_0333 [Paenibacillus algicola]